MMVKGLPLISLLLIRTWSLSKPRVPAVYDTLYWEGDIALTVLCDISSFEASEMSSSSAVTFCWSEHGLSLESLSSTRTCVKQLTVAECRPGPLTRQVVKC